LGAVAAVIAGPAAAVKVVEVALGFLDNNLEREETCFWEPKLTLPSSERLIKGRSGSLSSDATSVRALLLAIAAAVVGVAAEAAAASSEEEEEEEEDREERTGAIFLFSAEARRVG